MHYEPPEPIERLEEIIPHPADKTFNALHDKAIAAKRELSVERDELARLFATFKHDAPEIQALKRKISATHNELIDLLRAEEQISREIQERNL